MSAELHIADMIFIAGLLIAGSILTIAFSISSFRQDYRRVNKLDVIEREESEREYRAKVKQQIIELRTNRKDGL